MFQKKLQLYFSANFTSFQKKTKINEICATKKQFLLFPSSKLNNLKNFIKTN